MTLLAQGKVTINMDSILKRNGNWIYYYRNGKKAYEGGYLNGYKNGVCTTYFENGIKSIIENYIITNNDTIINDTLDVRPIRKYLRTGTYIKYFKNGQIKVEGEYEIIPGYVYTFIVNTKTKMDYLQYVIGNISVKTGTWTEYFKDGSVKSTQIIAIVGLHYEE